ncbi:MAG: hypothetical protein JJ899_06900 [Alphaproteobacteria bacterium]|nr:hypothetical protein [Alphaproteobacteria bacterium]
MGMRHHRLAVAAALVLALVALAPAGGFAAESEEAAPEGVPEHFYVRLDAITVTLFDADSVVGLYTVAPTLEIAEAGQRDLVLAKRSKLRDAMFIALHNLVARRKSARIPLDAVKAHLRAVAQRTLGEEVVLDVFVENVLRKDG